MNSYQARPDPMPPGVRRVAYGVLCRLVHQPRLLRAAGSLLRRWPGLGGAGWAARRSAVEEVLGRSASFTNSSHTPNLVAGDFLIGMAPGPRYDADQAIFRSVLARQDVRAGADKEARTRSADLRARGAQGFDLIEDYLMWVVLRALEPAFGAASETLRAGSRSYAPDPALERRYMREVRHVAAHLFGGAGAPVDVQRRAELDALALRTRITGCLPELSMSWPRDEVGFDTLRRNAIGLAWVSHPVTVQAGALVVQELLGRRAVYAGLRARAMALGDELWSDAGFRVDVQHHVLELMRFRPVFPLLSRDVPRETEFETGASRNPTCRAGASVRVMTLAALFDTQATPDANRYRADRTQGAPAPWQKLMFGFGDRQCPASDQALAIVTSAVLGLLSLPRLCWADRGTRRISYDGPMVSRMNLRPRIDDAGRRAGDAGLIAPRR